MVREVISWPCELIKENEKLEPKGILSNYESQQHKPVISVCSRMLESITLNEASSILLVAESKPNKWRQSEQREM